MGRKAAKVGDKDTKGHTISSGSPDVFVNGQQAARVGDPIGPDTIVSGSPTVFINGKPFAAMGDKDNKSHTIVSGSNDVIIE